MKLSDNYVFNEQFGIYLAPDAEEFRYSDGEEEELRLFKNLRESRDNSVFSDLLKKLQVNWPTRYHLSSQRGNLLRPFAALLKDRSVLEIGAGCGAMSRFAGEIGARVTALEGSPLRAAITAARCRGLENVTVIADNFQSFSCSEKFDVVTLIGVLEYSRLFVKGADPVVEMLKKARSFLKPEGVLLLAIENQLGLKYFCGAPEDHVQKYAFGINDSYSEKTVVTFGRVELEAKLDAAGFLQKDLFLPFPDYKLPTTIVYPEGQIEVGGWKPGTLVASTVLFEAQPPPFSLFSLEQAWKVVSRNGLLADLSNSFLYCASPSAGRSTSSFSGVLAAHYGNEKCDGASFEEKHFALSDAGVLETRMFRGPLGAMGQQSCETFPYQPGDVHWEGLLKIINTPGWGIKEVSEWARPWVNALQRHLLPLEPMELEGSVFDAFLPPNFIDAIPQNLAISEQEGKAEFFDIELSFHTHLPFEFVVFRGLFIVIHRVRSCAKPGLGTPGVIGEIALQCFEAIIGPISAAKLQSFIKLFNTFHNLVNKMPTDSLHPLTSEFSRTMLPIRSI